MAKNPLKPVTLKELAALLELSQSTVSRVVNGGATAHRIAEETQQRVLEAAARYGYSANTTARNLRQKRTYTIGVLVPDISESYSSGILGGIEEELVKDGFLYFVVSHRHCPKSLADCVRTLLSRSVEGIIAVDTPINEDLSIPLVSVSRHRRFDGVTNIELHYEQAAHLALSHLKSLGHKRVAIIKGQVPSSDTSQRWQATIEMAKDLGMVVDPLLVVQLQGQDSGPGSGYEATRALLETGRSFTALFTFNDAIAAGAILALQNAGLHVPQDVSVLGFGDMLIATTNSPALTTIQQPLRAMGEMAASTLLGLIRDDMPYPRPAFIAVASKLLVRKSTGDAPESAIEDNLLALR